ncbi:MAG: PVC-type heme-binding CxxCH protein [Verrucomicrobiota bacterium]
MKLNFQVRQTFASLLLFGTIVFSSLLHAAPMEVLVVSDTDSFRSEYSAALGEGGAKVTTATTPNAANLARVDVVLLHQAKFESLPATAQAALAAFAQRGGGIVAVNAAVAAGTVAWGKAILGGAWDVESQKFNSRMSLYVHSNAHPIVEGASSFDVNDDTLYDLTLDDEIFVLGSAFTPKMNGSRRALEERNKFKEVRALIYDIQPQMWTFEDSHHRAAVFLQGAPETLKHASMRAFILRGIAWTARRDNVDELCSAADLKDLRYPVGGPQRANDVIKTFRMQPGFHASVVAAEPLVNKPISVQWDARGRLWVAETPEYPNGRRKISAEPWKETGVLEPGNYDRPGRDRISILEDTNGDGLMDKKTIFYEGLELITAFCMHRDGVVVASQPNLIWIRDTNGDDHADTVLPIFGGFAPGDTHFVPNHFMNAPDGWIYASSGGSLAVTKPGSNEKLTRIAPGLFRFKPDGSAIETVASQGGNAFGAEITSDFELFHGQATSGNPIQHVVLPETVLARAPNTRARSMNSVNPGRTVARTDLPDRAPLMQIDQVGRYSAACSTMVYEGGAWPKEYDGTIFTTEPILDIIHHERLKPVGPTFTGELILQDAEWLRSMDYLFSPIDVTFGPDGALYVLDFYTPVMAHNDTRGPRHSRSGASIRPDREHFFGRIYRIQHEDAPKLTNPDLTKADAAGLVSAFRHPNRVVRFNALRVLMEQADTLGVQAVPALNAMALDEKFIPARILALWALQRLDRLSHTTFLAAARSNDASVRKNAMLIAEAGHISLDVKELKALLNDPDARVRLAALRALGASPINAEAGAILLAVQPKFADEWSQAAAAAAASSDPARFLELVLAGDDDSSQREELARSLAASLVASRNSPAMLRVLQSAEKSRHATLAAAVLEEFGQSPPPGPSDATATIGALRAFLSSVNRPLAAAALPLAATWETGRALNREMNAATSELLAIARDGNQALNQRAKAVQTLLASRPANAEILPNILALLNPPQPEPFRRQLIAVLAPTGEISVGRALTAAFPTLPPELREVAFNALVRRPEWTELLLDALESRKIAPSVFDPAQTSRLSSHPDSATAKRARTLFALLGGGTNPAKDEIIARLLPSVEQRGNPSKGKELFSANCYMCHRLGNAGFEFGPALDGIGSHSAAELLMHIIDPSRMVDDEHRTWNITMKDGTQYSSLIANENASTVKLRQPSGVTVDLNVAEIASRTKGTNSLMPEGFEALGAEGLRDLISYLQSLAPKSITAVEVATDPRSTLAMGQKFAEPKPANTLRVLLVGAGSSHDFPRFFLGTDSEILRAGGGIETAATPNLEEALALLPQADVLVFSGNHAQFGTAPFQQALNRFADAGKGMVLLHAATWRNFPPATGYNQRFVGGGTRSHGYGEFLVRLKASAHPLLHGVPDTFKIVDENYDIELEAGANVEVLAENAPDKGSVHPSVWIMNDPKARIVCISLGHANEAHSNPAFKTLLSNAVKWAGGK